MNNQKILISAVAIIILGALGFIAYQSQNNPSDNPALIKNFDECAKAGFPIIKNNPASCRTANGELFVQGVANPSPLPNPNPVPTGKVAAGYVAGHITIGPFCPVERLDQPCQVPVEAYTSREAVVFASDANTVKDRIHLDAQGNYKIALTPGNYFIQIKPAGIGPGEKKNVTVKSFETSVVNFDIDTGIR